MGIVRLEHGEHGDEWALEVEDVFVILRFFKDGVEVDVPSDQLEKWERMAEREGKTVDEVVKSALDAAFSELDGDDPKTGR